LAADQSGTVSASGAQGGGRILGFRTADAAGRAGCRVLTRMDAGPSATLVLQREVGAMS
jgi:hypothetical protein